MSLSNQPCFVNGLIDSVRWIWSPMDNSESTIGSSIENGFANFGKLALRTVSIGTIGLIATYGANKIGIINQPASDVAKFAFSSVGIIGAVGGALIVYTVCRGVFSK